MSKNISESKKILDSFFENNEIVTNRLTAGATLVLGILFCGSGIIDAFVDEWLGGAFGRTLIIISGIINIIAFFAASTKKYKAPWIKNLTVNMIIFTSAVYMALYPLCASFLSYGPLVICALYYDKKMAYRTTVKCALIYGVIIWGHLILANCSPLIHEYHISLGIDELIVFSDVLIDFFIPHMILFAVTGWICARTAGRGKILLAREADITAQNNKMTEEFAAATKLQISSLPAEQASFYDGKIKISALMRPAKAVGGDFYDYFLIGDKLIFLVGDVSDKGLPAALFMMKAKNAVRAAFEAAKDFDRAIALANTLMYHDNSENMFITAWIGCIDIRSGVGKYANCGHVPPLIRKADGRVVKLNDEPNLMLGIFENPDITSYVIYFRPGDTIVIYSDGLTDAVNADGEAFGEGRLTTIVAGLDGEKLESENALISEIDRFAGEADQFDDMTSLVLHVCSLDSVKTMEISAAAGPGAAGKIIDNINELLTGSSCDEETRRFIDVMLDEICDNISSYAYKDEPGEIMVNAALGCNYLELLIKDRGCPFDPTAESRSADRDPLTVGGLGIYFYTSMADRLSYSYEDGCNCLKVIKIW